MHCARARYVREQAERLCRDTPAVSNVVKAQRLLGAAMVLGQKLDDKTASELAEGLVSPAEPPPPPEVAMPRLIVDWGDYPRLGHRSTPHFLLLCPDTYQQGRPQIHVQVDDLLDNDFPADKARTMHSEGLGEQVKDLVAQLSTAKGVVAAAQQGEPLGRRRG